MRSLGTFPGGNRSEAYGISADGSIIVGGSSAADGNYHAFRWREASGMEGLPMTVTPPRPSVATVAYSVSADGADIVGAYGEPPSHVGGFWWNQYVSGNSLFMSSRTLYGVSGDGFAAVGRRIDRNSQWGFRAILFEGSQGIRAVEYDLNEVYRGLLNGSHLMVASAVSPNGRYIVGTGYNRATGRIEAFLLDRGCPPRGDVNRDRRVDDADLLAVLFVFGGRGYRNEDINWDGTVDDADLLAVLFNFGSEC